MLTNRSPSCPSQNLESIGRTRPKNVKLSAKTAREKESCDLEMLRMAARCRAEAEMVGSGEENKTELICWQKK